MNRRHKTEIYTTKTAQDPQEGWAALELLRTTHGVAQLVARVVFWDAEGQFVLDATSSELPLDVVDEFLAEARATIKTG